AGAPASPRTRTLTGPAGAEMVFRSKPGHSPVWIRDALLTDAHLLENFLGETETINSGRHAAVNGNLQKDFAQFFLGDAVVQRTANMNLQFMRAIERRDHSKIQNAAAAAIKTRPVPDLVPTIFRRQLLQRPVEVGGRIQRIVDIGIPQHRPARGKATLELFA